MVLRCSACLQIGLLPNLLAKIHNLFLTTMLKAKKNILLSNSFCQQLVMIPLVAEEAILVALGVDNPGVVRLLLFIETAADGHLLVAVRL